MSYSVNESLVRLEENLKKLETARTQVEKTVKSHKELRDVVDKYVKGLNSYEDQLKEIHKLLSDGGEEIGKTGTEIIAKMSLFFDNTVKTFADTSEKILKDFQAESQDLTDSVTVLKGITNHLEMTLSEILELSGGTSAQLDTFQSQLDSANTKTQSHLFGLSNKLAALSQQFDSLKTQLDSANATTQSKLGGLSDKLDSLSQQLTHTDSSLRSLVAGVSEGLSFLSDDVKARDEQWQADFVQLKKTATFNKVVLILGGIFIILFFILR